MKRPLLVPVLLTLSLSAVPAAGGVEVSMQIVLEFSGDAERTLRTYECEGREPFAVEYINAVPTFLALVPVDGETRLFVNVISASGVRYASGAHEWLTKGSEAMLVDITAPEDSEPLRCLEMIETP